MVCFFLPSVVGVSLLAFCIIFFILIYFSGEISLESEFLLQRLKRNLPPGEEPTHLFALNFDVDIWNARKFLEMEGITRTG